MKDVGHFERTSPRIDLRRRVGQFLGAASLPALRRVAVEVNEDCVVVLKGQVQTFYEKQMAFEFARRVAGVVTVVNEVRVAVAEGPRRRYDSARAAGRIGIESSTFDEKPERVSTWTT